MVGAAGGTTRGGGASGGTTRGGRAAGGTTRRSAGLLVVLLEVVGAAGDTTRGGGGLLVALIGLVGAALKNELEKKRFIVFVLCLLENY